MAEWLRRLTRNQIPSGSVGSNPTDCESLIFFCWVLLTLPLVNLGKPSYPTSIVGSVVEWPPATRSARVQFPDDAYNFFLFVCLVGFVSFSHPFSPQKNGVENGSRNKRTRKVKKF